MEKFWLCTRCHSSSHWNHWFTASAWRFGSAAPRPHLASLIPQTNLLLSDTATRCGSSSSPIISDFQVCSVQACMHMCTCICGCTYMCVHGSGDLGLITSTLSTEAESFNLRSLMEWLLLTATFIWGPQALPSEAWVTGGQPPLPIIYVKSRESNSVPQPCRESTLTTKTSRFSFMYDCSLWKPPCFLVAFCLWLQTQNFI